MTENNYIPPQIKKTLPGIFLKTVVDAGSRPFARWLRNKPKWESLTWTEAGKTAQQLATILKTKHSVEPGDRVLVLCDSGPESVLLFYAIQLCGAAFVIREPRMAPSTVKMMADMLEPKLIVTQPEHSSTYTYVGLDKDSGQPVTLTENNHAANVSKWLSEGATDAEAFPNLAKNGPAPVIDADVCWSEEVKKATKSEDLSTEEQIGMMVTTSGTTGKPKAVMHGQKGMYYSALGIYEFLDTPFGAMVLPFDQGYISYTMVLHAQTRTGLCLHFVKRETLQSWFAEGWPKEVQPRPTVVLLLADSVGKLHKKMSEKIKHKGKFVNKILHRCISSRMRALDRSHHAPNRVLKGVKGFHASLGNKLVAKKIRNAFGGKATTIVTGAAKCPEDAIEFFCGCGLRVMEGYASTEGFLSTIVTSETFEKGSVGVPFVTKFEIDGTPVYKPNNEIKIAPSTNPKEDGVIYLRGDSVFNGYYNFDEKTKEVMDDEGWFNTGDLGHWVTVPKNDHHDEFRALKITGSDGRRFPLSLDGMPWVWPEQLEGYLLNSEILRDVCIVGTNQKYLIAIVNPALEEQERLLALPDSEAEKEVLESLWVELKEKGCPTYELPLRAIIEENDLIRTATGKHKKRSDVEKDKRYATKLTAAWEAGDDGMFTSAKELFQKLASGHF